MEALKKTESLEHAIGDPKRVYDLASRIAQEAQKIIEKHKLYILVRGQKHLRLEAWQAIGVPMGLFVKVVEAREIENGAIARAVVVRADGTEIGGGVGMCSRDEKRGDKMQWRDRNRQEILSMAQTRAMSKAFNSVIRWVPSMYGYSSTPAEEVIDESPGSDSGQPPQEPPGAQASEESLSKPVTRQRVYGLLGVVGFRDDEQKKAAMRSFIPGFTSTKNVPEKVLQELISDLHKVKEDRLGLTTAEDGSWMIVDPKEGTIVWPKQ